MSKTAMVILNHDDILNTERLVGEIKDCSALNRIIIADNSQKHDIKSLDNLKSEKADVLLIQNGGYARGNNLAVDYLKKKYGIFDYIIISNPDISIEPQTIEKTVDFLDKHPEYAVAAPKMMLPSGKPHRLTGWKERTFLCDLAYSSGLLSRIIGMYRETYPSEHWQKPFSDVDCVAGSFFIIRHSVFEQIGCFDEKTFLYYEEDILGFKLKKLGLKSAILNIEQFIHYEGVSVNKRLSILKKYLNMQKSRIYFQRKYKKINLFEYIALCAATILGTIEKTIKQIF